MPWLVGKWLRPAIQPLSITACKKKLDKRSEELPPPPDDRLSGANDARLWVGNLDSRVTEFVLLKQLQKFGHLKKFDFLYHKSGPDQGKPRGYCFASYHTHEEARKAIQGLNGKKALSKKLIVRWAHTDKTDFSENKADGRLQLLGSSTSQPVSPVSKESKIRLIEAKLRRMESKKEDFSLDSDNGSTSCSFSLDNSRLKSSDIKRTHNLFSKPYSRSENSDKDFKRQGSQKR